MIVCWHLNEPDGHLVIRHHQAVYTLANDDQYLYSGTRSGLFSVFFLDDFSLKKHLQLCEGPIFEVLPLANGALIAGGDGCLYLVDSAFDVKRKMQLSSKSLRTIIAMTNGYAVGASDGKVYLLNHALELEGVIEAFVNSVFALSYDAVGDQLICGGRDAVLKWYKGKECIREVKAHLLHIHRLAMSEDGRWVMSSGMDKMIKLWETRTGELLKVISAEKYGAHTSSVNKILWIDKNTIISCSDDRTLKCFEIQEK